ncbi:hypothetical protein ABW21_db0206894 [Orbilia brochopaga]|nr:hypothetical protein ABW21_db0206894 [Drechslerella brochopaga]
MRSFLNGLPFLATLLLYGASATPVLQARAPRSTEWSRPFPVDKNACADFGKAGTIEGSPPIDGPLGIDIKTFYHASTDGSTASIVLQDIHGDETIVVTFGALTDDITITGTVVTPTATNLKVQDAIFPADANNGFTQYFVHLKVQYNDPHDTGEGKYKFTFFKSNKFLTPGQDNKVVVKVPRSHVANVLQLFSTGICYKTTGGDGTLGWGLTVVPRGDIPQDED